MKKKMLTKSEKAAIVKAVGKIAALEFVAHKIALGYARQITLVQNDSVADLCAAVARLRSEYMCVLLTNDHRWGTHCGTCYEAFDQASVAACVAEANRHKAYTAKRLLAMLDEFEAIEVTYRFVSEFLDVKESATRVRMAINDLADLED